MIFMLITISPTKVLCLSTEKRKSLEKKKDNLKTFLKFMRKITISF